MQSIFASPLTDFVQMILEYFTSIWSFLLFVGGSAAVIVVLIGAIMMFVGVRVGKITGQKLILGGIILAIVIVYFNIYPPNFIIS
ncbi:MAG: hypothetical protein ACFFD3_12385 [Candidatus Thorarchaeota archaeon]